jgi:hypothetical protein
MSGAFHGLGSTLAGVSAIVPGIRQAVGQTFVIYGFFQEINHQGLNKNGRSSDSAVPRRQVHH